MFVSLSNFSELPINIFNGFKNYFIQFGLRES